MRRFLQPPQRFPKFDFKQLPFHMDEEAMRRVRIVGQFLGIILLTAFLSYIFLNNLVPFGVTVQYSLEQKHRHISDLGPKNRVKKEILHGQTILHQTHDLVYFTTEMPFQFDQATVRLTFKNPHPTQTISLGFQDQKTWHYDTKLFDIPFLNTLSWHRTGSDPVLYQHKKHFDTTQDFLANPPKDALIGTYAYDMNIGDTSTLIPDYQPASQETIIDTPLRGKHVFYAYLKNEPFRMIIQKQDLNWYEDPDPMTIKIYKNRNLVYQVTVDDDGIQDTSRKVLPAQEVVVKNPGPDLPETGVYKIVIEATNDTVIKSISTNLHKIVIQGSLFPVANSDAYSTIASSTSATTVYTNALLLSAMTYHNAGLQDITVDNQHLYVDMVKNSNTITPQKDITNVVIPKNDVVLNGFQGYFAFNESQFFLPTPYRIIPLTTKYDVDIVDYILADYSPSKKEGQWQINELTFDIQSAFIKNNKLSWVIMSPKLKENNREILIKDIDITFHKKPWQMY